MKDKELNIPVLITGVGFGSLGREIIKAFQLAENKYRIITTDISPTSSGLYQTKSRYVIPRATSQKYLKSIMKICKKEKIKIIVPGSEPETEKMAKNIHFFKKEGIEVLVNPWELIKKCSDKFYLNEFLKNNGFSVPNSFIYKKESDLSKIKKFPIVIKPRQGAGSRNVFLAQDMEEARFFSKYLKKYGSEVLIQEYVGDSDQEFTVGVLYSGNGKLKTSIAMKRMLSAALSTRQIGIHKRSKEKLVISSAISQGLIDDFKQVRKTAEKIAEVLQADGPINIQCRKIGSKIIPFEINPRFSGTTAARCLAGFNEPEIFTRYRLYNEIPKKRKQKTGYVLRDLQEKYISIQETKKIPKI